MQQIGVILQRSLLMLILICFPCWAFFINTENLLLLAKQDPKVARLAGDFVLICIPVLMERFVSQLQWSFLQNQGITVPQVFIGITANIINCILHYVFLSVLHLGVQAAALAINIAFISQIIMTFIYIWIKNLHVETWGGWSWECLQNWHQLTKLAVPSILALSFEWWIFDIGTILAGLINVTQQGVQSVMFQVVVFLYMIPYSMGNAVSVRVGNALGAGNEEQAKRSSTVALLTSGGSRTVIARLFTSDEEIISLTAHTLLVYTLYHIFESIACTSNGILKGMGKQKIGAVVYGIGYYVIGLPLELTLMFVAKFGVLGLWYGMTACAFVLAFFLTTYILRANWNTVKEEAVERTGIKQKKPTDVKLPYTHSFSGKEDDQSVLNGNPSDQLPINELPSPRDGTKSDFLPIKALILRRGLAAIVAMGLLGIGVLVRLLLVHE
ncbi:multidrug and toxin extrusion protein 2-like isoform X2 [Lissotriton helveticus]